MNELGKYGGYEILTTSAMVSGFNKQLSMLLDANPQIMGPDEITYLAVAVVKMKDRYDYAADADDGLIEGVNLVQMFGVVGVGIDEEAMGRGVIGEAQISIAAYAASQKGQLVLDLRTSVRRDEHEDLANAVDEVLGEFNE